MSDFGGHVDSGAFSGANSLDKVIVDRFHRRDGILMKKFARVGIRLQVCWLLIGAPLAFSDPPPGVPLSSAALEETPTGAIIDRLGNVLFRPPRSCEKSEPIESNPLLLSTFAFVPGHYYSSTYSSLRITEYDTDGIAVGSYTVPSTLGREVRGIAFGADGLLYVTLDRVDAGFAVLAMQSDGHIVASYVGGVYIDGNISWGKIAMDSQYLYVCGQNVLTRFLLGAPSSGTTIYTADWIFDVKPMPNGHLFVAAATYIDEITTNGVFMGRTTLSGGHSFWEIRGVEYNPATNTLFVTHLGTTDFAYRIMRIDMTTGAFLGDVVFVYPDDLFLDTSGNLLVGSRYLNPAFFSQDLVQLNSLNGGRQLFVTQYAPLPSPTPTPAPGLTAGGRVTYCSNSGPSVGVTLMLSGSSTASATSDASGNYSLTGLISGGSYEVVPTKSPLPPGDSSINTVDVIAVQQHYLNITVLPPGCASLAADVTGDSSINTFDVIAIQRFFIGRSSGTGNVGTYTFAPVSRSYSGIVGSEINQDYQTMLCGDIMTSGFR